MFLNSESACYNRKLVMSNKQSRRGSSFLCELHPVRAYIIRIGFGCIPACCVRAMAMGRFMLVGFQAFALLFVKLSAARSLAVYGGPSSLNKNSARLAVYNVQEMSKTALPTPGPYYNDYRSYVFGSFHK